MGQNDVFVAGFGEGAAAAALLCRELRLNFC